MESLEVLGGSIGIFTTMRAPSEGCEESRIMFSCSRGVVSHDL